MAFWATSRYPPYFVGETDGTVLQLMMGIFMIDYLYIQAFIKKIRKYKIIFAIIKCEGENFESNMSDKNPDDGYETISKKGYA